MANYRAIAAVSEALVRLLHDAYDAADFDGASARFEVYQTGSFKTPMKAGLSLWLWRVEINSSLRNLPPRLGPDGGRYRPSLPLDLHYLLTAWGESAPMQQMLLGWGLRVLQDTPLLPSGVFDDPRWPGAFHPSEAVELIAYQLPVGDMLSLWEVIRPNQQPSVAYVARMVLVDSDVPLREHDPVQTRAFDYREAALHAR
jgi:hypothetical protein